MATIESDEALARRLQAQEMGIRQPDAQTGGTPDAQTPLMHDGRGTNPTVLNSRLNELAGARMSVYVICGINIPQVPVVTMQTIISISPNVDNIPQVVVGAILLLVYWGSPPVCGDLIDSVRACIGAL